MADLPGNLKAFLAAAVLMAAVSLALVEGGVIGDDDNEQTQVGAATVTPAVLGESESPVAATPAPTVSPTPSPQAREQEPVPLVASRPITWLVEVPILMYHRILPAMPDDESAPQETVTVAEFEEQLSYLECAGFSAITVAEMFDALEGHGPLPERPIVLTFDDGWAEHYSYAFPLLRSHGLVGSFSIASGLVGANEAYMTWDQVEEMSGGGMEMLSHTVSHYDLNTPDDDETGRRELTRSRADIERHTGQSVRFFVYPSGEPFRSGTEERQAEVVEMLENAGYRGALLAGPGHTMQDPAAPFTLHRMRVTGGLPLAVFAGSFFGPAPDEAGC